MTVRNSGAASESGDFEAQRLAVFETQASEEKSVTIISTTKSDDNRWSISYSGEEDPHGKLRSLIEHFVAVHKAQNPGDPIPLPPNLADLAMALRQAGYRVEFIPANDHHIEFQMDFRTGRMVGSHSILHDAAKPNEEVARRIFEKLQEVLSEQPRTLAREISLLLDDADTEGALRAFRAAWENGILSLPPSMELLTVLIRFDPGKLDAEDARFVRETRMGLASNLNQFDVAARDANALLEVGAEFSPQKTIALKTTVALGAITRGHRETGLSMLRELLARPEDLDANGRAWTWRNISIALEDDDPEARRAAQLSADAFLEAGNKMEAAKSLHRLANLLLRVDPKEAVYSLEAMIALLDSQGILDRSVRASALHAKADRLSHLNQHEQAFQDASEAVSLLRDLFGSDLQLVSSLHLAALEALHLGKQSAATALQEEAERITNEQNLSHFKLTEKLSMLAATFDSKAANELLAEAKDIENFEVTVGIRILQARLDPTLTDSSRLEILEDTRDLLLGAPDRAKLMSPLRLAMGQLLAERSQFARAQAQFSDVLDDDPFDGAALGFLIDCLWKQEKWADAAILLSRQIGLKGDLPGLTFALGRSQFEAGNLTDSIRTLSKLVSLDEQSPLRRNALGLREKAIQLSGTIPTAPPKPLTGAVTREEFEVALSEFAQFIAGYKRMRFWRSDGKRRHKWVSSPEGVAQDLLHTALKTHFRDRVEIFEEALVGAGRSDLFALFQGGLSVVIELKLCGPGYSSNYAASGQEQIRHYMENRKTHLGYLVVFDARSQRYGTPLIAPSSDNFTIVERIIDIRSHVKRDAK
jgi:tetratricopeptide (TPR) repeat protein